LGLIEVIKEDVSLWEKACTGDNITVYRKKAENSPVVLLKAHATLENISVKVAYEVMSN